MNLTQIYNLVSKKTAFRAPDYERFAAINAASNRAYQAVLKENSGYWIKTDTTTVTIVPNTVEYTLPADLEQILRVREKLPTETAWRIVRHQDLASHAMLRNTAADFSISYDGCGESQFSFFGPYLKETTVAGGIQTNSIQIAPLPQDTRQVEIVYSAKNVEVASVGDAFMIPDEGRDFILDFAVAEIWKALGDERAGAYYESADQKLTYFLTVVRARQEQDPPTIEPYISDLD